MFAFLHAGLSPPYGGTIFASMLAVLALAAVFARTPTRRADARKVLDLLLLRGARSTHTNRPQQ
ncbi:hypothetical protein GQF42_01875 [Streptomyces broussonetiae]|uniref:Uncharacterized protein n=1 Tax=Streptomyces broussonetiae TaxID=2686304 RepID=A0A6I6MPB3_9ACTN|nr:hypothetical protein [Streptomyces broussonetiae]QHA02238.1 hypothetical protein GQF42_01875 [Streptomyces broussonetiae]